MKVTDAKLIAESTGCPGCAKLADEYETAYAVVHDKQRQLNRAKGVKREAHGKIAEQVREVIAEWKRVRPEHAHKAAEPGSKRWEQIEARLRGGCAVEDCKLAPLAVDKHRFTRHAGSDVRHIYCSESMVEELAALARGEQRAATAGYDGPRGVQALLDRLEHVRQESETQWNACCPAHDDRKASLRIAQAEDRVLVKCMARCSSDDVLAAVGLSMPALFEPPDAPVKLPAAKPARLPSIGQVQAWHRDLLGHSLLLERVRAAKGWGLPTLRHFAVGWDNGEKRLMIPSYAPGLELRGVLRYQPKSQDKMRAWPGSARDLFPLPEVVPTERVWLVEGEPDGISAFEYGLPAVAIPGVGFASQPEKWTHRLKDRRVVVCFDCDDPGRGAAEKVCHGLAEIARDVRNVDLDPSRSDGWDLSDALLAGVSGRELRQMAGSAGSVTRFAA